VCARARANDDDDDDDDDDAFFLRPPPKRKKLKKTSPHFSTRAQKNKKFTPSQQHQNIRERERYKRKHAHHLQFVSNTIAFCRDEDDDDESEEFARVLDFFSFFFFFFFEELEIAPVLDEEESIAEKAL